VIVVLCVACPMGENVLVVMLSFVARLTLVVKETHPLLHAMTLGSTLGPFTLTHATMEAAHTSSQQ